MKLNDINRPTAEEEVGFAARCMEWLDLLKTLRAAADKRVPAETLIEQIRRIDPVLLEHDRLRLEVMLIHYFERRGRQMKSAGRIAAVRPKETLEVDQYLKAMVNAGKSTDRGYKKNIIRELAKQGVRITKDGLIKWEKRHGIPPVGKP